jgi:uncharacterized membrane protein YkvA (DUF1232 family)
VSLLVRILLGVAVSLALAWALFIVFLVLVRPRGIGLREARRLIPDVARLVRDIARDNTVPRGVRRRLAVVVVYLALPIDLIPDFVPLLGYADDVIIVAWGLRSAVRRAGPDAVARHWRGSEEGLAVVRALTGIRPSSED